MGTGKSLLISEKLKNLQIQYGGQLFSVPLQVHI